MTRQRKFLGDSATEASTVRGPHLKQNDMASAVAFFLFGLITAILSLRMPVGTFRAAGSGLFPLLLGVLLMALSSLFMVKLISGAKEKAREPICAPEEAGSPLVVVAFIAIIALTTLLLTTIGYPLASFLLMVGLLRVLGSKRWPLNLTLSLLTAAGSHAVFVYMLKIPLPKGFLGI